MIGNMFTAIAYIGMACVVNDLFIASERSVLERRLGFIAPALAAGALLQVAMMLAPYLAVLHALAGLCLVAVPVSLWPVAARLRQGKLRVLNRRLSERAERAEAAALAARNWLDLAEQSGHVGHWQLTVPDNRLLWSDETFRIHGLWREHYRPRIETALAAFHPIDGKRLGELLQESVENKGRFEAACRLRRPDGEIRHVILRAAAAAGNDGRVESLNGVIVDVTEPKRAEAALLPPVRELEFEDEMTGLASQKQFELSLGYEFKRAVRSRKPLGIALLEIDHFHAYAEHYGPLERNACLRAVAQAIQAMPRRTGDVVARYGNAGIAVLLPLADAAGAECVANMLAETVRGLGLNHVMRDSGSLTVSIGAAAFVGMDDLYNPAELTRRAERALSDAQAAGGNQVRGFQAAACFVLASQTA